MTDVTVMGGGIFGLAVAFALARRRAPVRLVEARRIGAGSSGGLVGALAPHVPENWNAKKRFQLESLLMAEEFWNDVAALSGVDPGYARLGRIQPLADDAAVAGARARAEEATTLWQGKASWSVVGVENLGPHAAWAGESRTRLYAHDTLSARLNPRQALRALAAAIHVLGGEIVEEAGDARAPSGTVVWATGVNGLLGLTNADGSAAGDGVRGQAALFSLAVPDHPQLFASGLHVVPHADGTVAVGSTSERDWRGIPGTDERLEELIARARAAAPLLREAPVIERWAGVRPRARTRAPVLGPWPGRPGHFIANGGFKIGFGMAPGVAETMADLLLDGRDAIPEGFRVADCLSIAGRAT